MESVPPRRTTAIREHVDTNLLGMVNTLDAVLPNMLARRSGRLVGVASVAGYRGFTGAEAYETFQKKQDGAIKIVLQP